MYKMLYCFTQSQDFVSNAAGSSDMICTWDVNGLSKITLFKRRNKHLVSLTFMTEEIKIKYSYIMNKHAIFFNTIITATIEKDQG